MVQELLIDIDKAKNIPLNRQIYERIRKAILTGTLHTGDLIPPSRQLAGQLEISRSVVIQAYEQLQAEGYLIMKKGSGTFVADNAVLHLSQSKNELNRMKIDSNLNLIDCSSHETAKKDQFSVKYDFKHGVPAWDVVPMDQWQKSLVRTCRQATPDLLGYGPVEGSYALRKEIARLLRSSRSIPVEPEQIVITTGATQALDILARLFIKPGDQVIAEDPAHSFLHDIFHLSGAKVVPVPVDQQGLRVDQIDKLVMPQEQGTGPAKLAYVTPSHQFPTGVTLSLERRLELLDWAEREGAYIIEDDYDSEYRYVGKKVSALAGLDVSGRIVYVGSFSKILFPALRIGYAVLPHALVQPFLSIKQITDRMTPSVEQEALADFIRNGQYAKHVNQMGKLYAAKRSALVLALEREFGKRIRYYGDQAGLHLLIEINSNVCEEAVAARALHYGVRVYPAGCYFTGFKPDNPTFVLGYSNLCEEQIDVGIRRFAQAEIDCTSREVITA
ncbi:PLP-dependent aminotransferase family protein [Paenibacillus sp. YPG26]|uniref:MocR-like pyridoxine biosynthesis transcription factor PdxR n=1 Tax=Paenibacillus sp. YPG26 TaxID=2878915 RepID=UPI00203B8F37|nr:PLP-dependent aminotransferase family protein [Paenibacillus sp. YPG26]USB31722.1 PLP-dependent aminotransferase family protein [Paenibacillus sp. YPG26]